MRMMEYSNIEAYIRAGQYMEASNLMLKESLQDRINELSTRKREVITKRIARALKQNHQRLLVLRDSGDKPMVIAQEAYEQTREDLGLDQFDPIITLGEKHSDVRPRQGTDQPNDLNR